MSYQYYPEKEESLELRREALPEEQRRFAILTNAVRLIDQTIEPEEQDDLPEAA